MSGGFLNTPNQLGAGFRPATLASPKRPQVSTLGGLCRPGPPRPGGNFGVTQAAEWSKRVVAGSWPLGERFAICLEPTTMGDVVAVARLLREDRSWHVDNDFKPAWATKFST